MLVGGSIDKIWITDPTRSSQRVGKEDSWVEAEYACGLCRRFELKTPFVMVNKAMF